MKRALVVIAAFLSAEQQLRAGLETRNPAQPDSQAGQRLMRCARQDLNL